MVCRVVTTRCRAGTSLTTSGLVRLFTKPLTNVLEATNVIVARRGHPGERWSGELGEGVRGGLDGTFATSGAPSNVQRQVHMYAVTLSFHAEPTLEISPRQTA